MLSSSQIRKPDFSEPPIELVVWWWTWLNEWMYLSIASWIVSNQQKNAKCAKQLPHPQHQENSPWNHPPNWGSKLQVVTPCQPFDLPCHGTFTKKTFFGKVKISWKVFKGFWFSSFRGSSMLVSSFVNLWVAALEDFFFFFSKVTASNCQVDFSLSGEYTIQS